MFPIEICKIRSTSHAEICFFLGFFKNISNKSYFKICKHFHTAEKHYFTQISPFLFVRLVKGKYMTQLMNMVDFSFKYAEVLFRNSTLHLQHVQLLIDLRLIILSKWTYFYANDFLQVTRKNSNALLFTDLLTIYSCAFWCGR